MGVYLEEGLGKKMKISILASGFDASDVLDVKSPTKKASSKEQSNKPAEVNGSDIEAVYGSDAVRDMERKRLQIVLLTREQMDNDAQLEMFDKEPTYNRSTDFKQRFIKAGEKPVAGQQPENAKNETINFGE